MSTDVKIRFRSFLPGAGHDSSGNARQGKTNVRGVIEVTNYTRGGETLTPADLGLSTIDDLVLTHREPVSSPDPAAGVRRVVYSYSAQQFYIIRDTVEEAATADPVISFDAFGDSSHDVELL